MSAQNKAWSSGRDAAAMNKSFAPMRTQPAVVRKAFEAGFAWQKRQMQLPKPVQSGGKSGRK